MTVTIRFWEALSPPGLILFGLDSSATLGDWTYEQEYLDLLDQVPWGRRPDGASETVREAGALLRQKLAAVPSVNRALVDALNNNSRVSGPLFFRVCPSPTVEDVPFEVVWDEHLGSFVCLDRLARWPIVRIPDDSAVPPGPFTMERTVRVLAVLAAKNVPPWGQLEALWKARASQPELHVEMHILTSSSELVSLINDRENSRWRKSGWTAELVPADPDGLVTKLLEIQPHLLHIFCHGTARGPQLLIAQRDDLAEMGFGESYLEDLYTPFIRPPWLVTLWCCEGATTSDQTVSLVSGLLRSAGMPAVLGMRRAVDAKWSEEFCFDVYRRVFSRLAEIAPRGRRVTKLDWPALLHEPRRRLCTVYGPPVDVAGRQKEWTMPVLYLATTSMGLRGMPTANLDEYTVLKQIGNLTSAYVNLNIALDDTSADAEFKQTEAERQRTEALDTLYPENGHG